MSHPTCTAAENMTCLESGTHPGHGLFSLGGKNQGPRAVFDPQTCCDWSSGSSNIMKKLCGCSREPLLHRTSLKKDQVLLYH